MYHIMFVKSMFVVIRVRLMFTEPKMRMSNGRQITKQQINRKELCVMKKQIFAKMAAAVIILGTVAGCGQTQKGVSITIGNWPTKEQSGYETVQKNLDMFKSKHSDWKVKTSEYVYDTKSFTTMAAGGRLPTVWAAPFTEIDLISKAGYCADISKNIKEMGMDKIINPDLLKLVTGKNGEIWGLPHNAYAQGLTINKKLFKEAGLVNEDGSVKIPQDYDELAEFAGIVREKTGQAGFVIPTMNNQGGWNFMNIAWSYGTEFMKQKSDGTWKATFDSDEFKNSLKWLYDMKWKYNAFPEDTFIDHSKRMQYIGTYQAAMTIAAPVEQTLVTKYDMDKDDIVCTRLPKGPAGRFAQTGGAVEFFNAKESQENINAALTWYKEGSFALEITPEQLEKSENSIKSSLESGRIVLPKSAFPDFVNRKGEEKLNALYEKYSNIDKANYADYYSFEDVTLKAEEPVCCQQLYATIDGIIQEILTKKDVNIDNLVKTAANDFQNNYLNNEK